MNENRVLVAVKQITAIEPLTVKSGEIARTELAHIGGWRATVQKDEFKVGDVVVFAEPDSIFPPDERWSFLERRKWAIKTQRYGNLLTANGECVISQGLILPLSVLPDGTSHEIGTDVTKVLGVVHAPEADNDDEFEDNAEFTTKDKVKLKWLPKGLFDKLMRYKWFRNFVLPHKEKGGFVPEVSKTDEERIQNCGSIVEADTLWTATEKVDGTSSTFRLKKIATPWYKRMLGKQNFDFAVCTRNNRVGNPSASSIQWVLAKKYNLMNVMKHIIGKYQWVAIQGEAVGPKIQKNRQGLTENKLLVFNLIYPDGRRKTVESAELLKKFGVEWVPIIAAHLDLHGKTEEDLLKMADGVSALNPDRLREGIVFRAENPNMNLSFKAVSPEYALKHGL
jgi:hypothetical protein